MDDAGMRAWPWVAGACAVAIAACGGKAVQQTRVFSAAGMRIHFRYPADFRRRSVSFCHCANLARVGVSATDTITVIAFKLPRAITAREAKPTVDRSLSQLLERPMSGMIGTARGLMTISYPWTGVPEPHLGASSRFTDILTGRQRYEIDCEATAANFHKIDAACNQALTTVSVS
jgi:hypothetical protein